MNKAEIENRISELKAERMKCKLDQASLKLCINSVFGKSSDLFSAIYDPQMTANVTVLGQLGLLTLIQMLEGLATVCSANTDGVSILLKKSHWPAVKAKLDLWQSATELDLERTDYTGLYQKDVNNYVAAKPTAEVKLKGRFVDKWPNLRGMPNANIVATAVSEHAARGLSIKHTIHRCRDLNQFLLTQNVNSDWTTSWNDKQLGNILRFYKSNRPDKAPIIRTPKSGSDAKGNEGVVPDSDGCVPVEDLPEEFPEDINYGWYVREAEKLWKTISAAKRRGGNQWAELYHRMGLRPCPVDPKVKTPSRAGVAYGTIDFTSLPEGWVIGTATGAGILARVHADPPSTRLFRVDRNYPSKTRAKVLKDHGFVQYYGARVPLYGAPILEDPPKDENLDSYYTPAELNRLTQ